LPIAIGVRAIHFIAQLAPLCDQGVFQRDAALLRKCRFVLSAVRRTPGFPA
jgi:hypothetical protein